MNKFICKKVKRIGIYQKFVAWVAKTFLKIEIFYATADVLQKEVDKTKRIIKNTKRFLRSVPEEDIAKQFSNEFNKIKALQKMLDIMERELRK